LINIIISLTPRELTGISSAATSDMRIIGGAIGPVIATVIVTSILVSIEVDGSVGQYPSPTAFNIVFIVGLVLSIVATILVMAMRRGAVKARPTEILNTIFDLYSLVHETKVSTILKTAVK
jgi:MFS family permease